MKNEIAFTRAIAENRMNRLIFNNLTSCSSLSWNILITNDSATQLTWNPMEPSFQTTAVYLGLLLRFHVVVSVNRRTPFCTQEKNGSPNFWHTANLDDGKRSCWPLQHFNKKHICSFMRCARVHMGFYLYEGCKWASES